MEKEQFRKLFRRLIAQYELAPDTAAELLQKILHILKFAEANQTYTEKFPE